MEELTIAYFFVNMTILPFMYCNIVFVMYMCFLLIANTAKKLLIQDNFEVFISPLNIVGMIVCLMIINGFYKTSDGFISLLENNKLSWFVTVFWILIFYKNEIRLYILNAGIESEIEICKEKLKKLNDNNLLLSEQVNGKAPIFSKHKKVFHYVFWQLSSIGIWIGFILLSMAVITPFNFLTNKYAHGTFLESLFLLVECREKLTHL